MLTTTLMNVLAFLPQGGQGASTAPVVINEFNYDDTSGDDFEFVELYNRSTQPVDLSNWSLVGDDSNGPNFTETFPVGTILNPGDFLVIGDPNVPNVDILLASGFLQNSTESITLFDASQVIVDTLVYEVRSTGIFNPALVEGEGIWGRFTCIEGNESSWSRFRDGFDSNDNGYDFRLQPWSPGTSNNQPYLPTVVEVFDSLPLGADVPSWGSSWVNPVVIDPSIVDNNNPSVIPQSPQGAFAGVLWDPLGGDSGMLLADPTKNGSFEAYVYIPSNTTGVDEREMWSVGFGTTGTFYDFPDPTGALGNSANGNTGVSWTFVRDEFGANIYLVDHNNGGLGANAITNATTIGTIPITAGVNDGWQRLRIEVIAGNVIGRFGGTYGAQDGTVFTGIVDDVDRGLYVGYRNDLTAQVDARPFTWDLMTFTSEASARATPYGLGCDNLTLTTTGAPTIGNGTFSLEVNNIGSVPLAFVAFGTAPLNPGADLTAIGMAGCFGYTSFDLGLFQTGSVVGNTGSLPLPIPSASIFIGSTFWAQGVSFSPTTSLGLAASNGIAMLFGL